MNVIKILITTVSLMASLTTLAETSSSKPYIVCHSPPSLLQGVVIPGKNEIIVTLKNDDTHPQYEALITEKESGKIISTLYAPVPETVTADDVIIFKSASGPGTISRPGFVETLEIKGILANWSKSKDFGANKPDMFMCSSRKSRVPKNN